MIDKRENMILDKIDFKKIGVVVTAPKISGKNIPKEVKQLRDEHNLIVKGLLKFSVKANFFNYESCPAFLKKDNKFLYLLLEKYWSDIYLCLGEALISKKDYLELQNSLTLNKPSSKSVLNSIHESRLLRSYFVSLGAALDCLHGGMAILLRDMGDPLSPDFQVILDRIKDYSQRPQENLNTSSESTALFDILEKIAPLIHSSDEDEEEWYEFFRHQRNFLSHALIPIVPMLQDEHGKFHTFLIRKHPYFFEDDLKIAGEVKQEASFEEQVKELLIHQCIAEYLNNAFERVVKIIDESFKILTDFYEVKAVHAFERHNKRPSRKAQKHFKFKKLNNSANSGATLGATSK